MVVPSYDYVYEDLSLYSDDFLNGLRCLKISALDDARYYFQLAYESVKNHDVLHNKYASFCGFLRVLHGDPGGLILCRDVARNEQRDGDVFLNLGRAEWFYDSRKKTVDAILRGLEVDGSHAGLRQMLGDLGVRRRKVVPWLNRDNLLNTLTGRLMRKKDGYWVGDYPFRF